MTGNQLRFVRQIVARTLCLTVLLPALIAGVFVSPVSAQEPETPPAPPVTAETPAEPATPQPAPVRLWMIPFQDLKQTLSDVDASVMVPLKEFLELQKQLREKPVAVPAAITSATYDAVVDKDLATIKVTLTIQSAGKHWTLVPLNFGEAAITSVEGTDESVILSSDDKRAVLYVGKSGEHTLNLVLTSRVHTLPEGRQLALSVPPVAITSFKLNVPDADQTVEITPRQVVRAGEAVENRTVIQADVGSTSQIQARWYPKAGMKPEMELLASATSELIVSVEEGLVHRDAWFNVEVLRGQLSQLRFAVPKDSRVLDVSGNSRIRNWKTGQEDKRQVITVDLLSATPDPVSIEIHTESPAPADALQAAGIDDAGTVNGIHALDVVRETGFVAIRSSHGLEWTTTAQQRLSRVDAPQAPERLREGTNSIYRYFSPEFVLTGEAKPVEPRLTATLQHQLVFQTDELRLTTTANYLVERAGLFDLKIKVPEGLVIDEVACPAMREYRFDEPTRTLIVTLAQRQQGNIAVTVTGHLPLAGKTESTEFPLPIPEALGAVRETGTIKVFARPSVEVAASETGVTGAQPVAAPPGQRVGDAVLSSSWSYTRQPVVIPVKITRKAARLSAQVATSIRVQPQVTEVATSVIFNTQFAGLDTVRLIVPADVSERVRIESASSQLPVRQSTPGPAENGWVTWTVVMQREMTGNIPLKVTYDLQNNGSRPADGEVISLVRALGTKDASGADIPLISLSGQVAVAKDDLLSVEVSAAGGDIEPIDVRELSMPNPSAATAFRYFTQPADAGIKVTLKSTRNEPQPVVATVIERALVEVVTGDRSDSSATFRARYKMKSTERQRLLIHLPVNLELLGAFVDNRDIALEKANIPSGQRIGESWEPYWLNVSRPGSNDDQFVVSLNFLWKIIPPLGGGQYSRGELELPLPVFGTLDSQAAVQELRVAAWTPRDYALVGQPAGFHPLNEPRLWSRLPGLNRSASESIDLEAWLGATGTPSATLPREGRHQTVFGNVGGALRLRVNWWNRLRVTWIASLALVLISLVLVRTTWENRLAMVLIGVLIFVLYGLNNRHAAAELLSASRYGLLFLFGLWIVHGLLGRRKPRTTAATPPAAATPAPGGA